MKCANCNGINVEGTRFCMYCGSPMQAYQYQPQQQVQPVAQMYQGMQPQQRVQMYPGMRPVKRQLSQAEKNKRIKIAGITAGAFVFLLTLILIISSGSVDVKDYVKVDFTGRNGNGKASVVIDREAFIRDYTGKIKYTNEYKKEKEAMSRLLGGDGKVSDEKAAYTFIRDCVTVSCENKKDLSNGDTVIVHIKYNKSKLKNYDLDLEDETFEVKVSGLGKDNNKKASKKKHSVDDVIDMHDWDF